MLAGLRLVPRHARAAGSLILRYLGYAIPPAASSFLAAFFKDIFKINLKMDWERIWGRKAHSGLQRRAISIRGNWAGSPSILVTTLDSFNDFLVQRFSRAHKRLKGPFRKAAGKKAKIPDFGTWLTNPALIAPLPNARPGFVGLSSVESESRNCAATNKRTGQFTRPVSYLEKDPIVARLRTAYFELLTEWARI